MLFMLNFSYASKCERSDWIDYLNFPLLPTVDCGIVNSCWISDEDGPLDSWLLSLCMIVQNSIQKNRIIKIVCIKRNPINWFVLGIGHCAGTSIEYVNCEIMWMIFNRPSWDNNSNQARRWSISFNFSFFARLVSLSFTILIFTVNVFFLVLETSRHRSLTSVWMSWFCRSHFVREHYCRFIFTTKSC